MLFMNDFDIADAITRHPANTPAGKAARFIRDFRNQVNNVSDGWAYWAPPLRAAKKMMELASCSPLDARNKTDADFRAALTPIRSFMTRRGNKAGIRLPDTEERTFDVAIDNHGSIAIIRPLTDQGRAWVDENIGLESWQWIGGGFACEPRYVANIVAGMTGDGLAVADPFGMGER